MKLTIKSTVENREFAASLQHILQLKLPAQLAYKFSKLARKLQDETDIYNEVRLKEIKKYAQLDEKGEPLKSTANLILLKDDEAKDAWKKEWEELVAQEIELPVIPPSMVLDDRVNIEPVHLYNLDAVISNEPKAVTPLG